MVNDALASFSMYSQELLVCVSMWPSMDWVFLALNNCPLRFTYNFDAQFSWGSNNKANMILTDPSTEFAEHFSGLES